MTSSLHDCVQFWHYQAARTPLLTAGQEITLGRQVQDWLSAEHPTPKQIWRGRRAKDRMIKSNLKLVISVSKKYSRRVNRTANLEIVDLYQEGVIGLNRAAEKFNPESGYKFSTYAFWWISQSLIRLCETQSATIRAPNTATQMNMRWMYRPEGQTLEQFANNEGKPVIWVKKYLEGFQLAQTTSLDAHKTKDEESSLMIDFASTGAQDIEETEFTDILQQLRAIPEIQDSLAILDLAQGRKPGEIAPLLNCSPYSVRTKLKDYAAQIREHIPADLRERLNCKEKNECVRIEPIIPLPEPSPLKEMALVNCCSTEPESMPEVSTNGHHHSLEAQAASVINELQSPEPTKQPRKRRSSAEVALERHSADVSLTINGCLYEGSPQAIASVLKAMAA